MNTTLKTEYKEYISSHLGPESSLPSIQLRSDLHSESEMPELRDDDGLFFRYGFISDIFPYRMQDNYDRAEAKIKYKTVILENEHLRAEFLPEWGGKLWSLFDKDAGRELLYKNPIIRPCNLALRNAWTAGGIEWNCGIVGHNPFTCSSLHTAVTSLDDGTPVLRVYEFERIRRAVFQIDFFLPEGSKLLFVRSRIVNTRCEVIPMYWWSNIAVDELEGARVICNAEGDYLGLNEDEMPFNNEGKDITYPKNLYHAQDHFWRIKQRKRKFECQLDSDGYGLIECSTSRLTGRKLFVWGQTAGSTRWQEYLTTDGSDGRYVELQAGLAHTQYEHLPMPPMGAWEFLEGYGAMQCNPADVHGDFNRAKNVVADALNEIITDDALEDMLEATAKMAKSPAEKVIHRGSGWGALENLRREKAGEKPICPHLDFGEIGDEQAGWAKLLEDGEFDIHKPDDIPASWMLQDEWTSLLEKSVEAHSDNWYALLQLANIYIIKCRYDDAEKLLNASIELSPSAWAYYSLAHINARRCDMQKAAELAQKAYLMKKDDISLLKESLTVMIRAKCYEDIIKLRESIPAEFIPVGRVRMLIANAYAHLGDIANAEKLLYPNGGDKTVIEDIRESEMTFTDLYVYLARLKAEQKGEEFDKKNFEIPLWADFNP